MQIAPGIDKAEIASVKEAVRIETLLPANARVLRHKDARARADFAFLAQRQGRASGWIGDAQIYPRQGQTGILPGEFQRRCAKVGGQQCAAFGHAVSAGDDMMPVLAWTGARMAIELVGALHPGH